MRQTAYRVMGAMMAATLAVGVWPAAAGNVPFMESFDNLANGPLVTLNNWETLRTRDVQVQATTKFDGAKAAVVGTNSLMWNNFSDATVTNVWIDFYARQAYPTNNTPPTITGSVAAVFYIDTTGSVRVLNGSSWQVLNYTVPSNTWCRYTVNLDYPASRWGLYMADSMPNRLVTPLATNLSFAPSCTNTYFHSFRVKN